jgi:methionine-rich copper-binding protein CopC
MCLPWFISGVLTLFISVGSFIAPASAHTKLINSDPKNDTIIQYWPGQVILTFDDNLQTLKNEKINFVVVNNAQGDQVSADDEVVTQNILRVSLLPNTIQGPVLVTYRVVGKDGHPIEGEFAFSFGQETPPADSPNPNQSEVATSSDSGSNENRNIGIFVYSVSAIFILSGVFIAMRRAKSQN